MNTIASHNLPVIYQISKKIAVCFLDKFFDSTQEQQQTYLDYILKKINKDVLIIGTLVWENRSILSWGPAMVKLASHRQLILILDSVYRFDYNIEVPSYFIDFFLLKTYFELCVKKSSEYSKLWNHGTGQFLFLTGKPAAIHRCKLLQHIINHKLEKNCVWSFFVSPEATQKVQQLLNLNDIEFENFVAKYVQSPDKISPQHTGSGLHLRGFPYNHDMYTQTSFRLISETQFEKKQPWITEKTWTTIANHHPFIMAANSGTLEKLKSMNICTFEKYLEIDHYDSITDSQQRIDAIIINTKYWVKNIHKFQNLIRPDVEKNHKIFFQLAEKNLVEMKKICDNLKISYNYIYRILPIFDAMDTWSIFYNSVRDESWPDCWSEKDFVNLPQSIKDECIHVHGYKPLVDIDETTVV